MWSYCSDLVCGLTYCFIFICTHSVPPSFTTTPEDITVRENEPFVFTSTCTGVGEPKPVITWLRADGTVIPVENEVPQFGILTRADAGVFVCMAENSAGQARSQFIVTVQGMSNKFVLI